MITSKKIFRHRCEVDGCTNRRMVNKNVKFYHLPREPDRLKKWLDLINRPDLLQRKYLKPPSHLVCSVHFERPAFTFELRLSKDALPTKYLSMKKGDFCPTETNLEKIETYDKTTQTQDPDLIESQVDDSDNTGKSGKSMPILVSINANPSHNEVKNRISIEAAEITKKERADIFTCAVKETYIMKKEPEVYKPADPTVTFDTTPISGKRAIEIALWEAELKKLKLEEDIAILSIQLQNCNAIIGKIPYCRN